MRVNPCFSLRLACYEYNVHVTLYDDADMCNVSGTDAPGNRGTRVLRYGIQVSSLLVLRLVLVASVGVQCVVQSQ